MILKIFGITESEEFYLKMCVHFAPNLNYYNYAKPTTSYLWLVHFFFAAIYNKMFIYNRRFFVARVPSRPLTSLLSHFSINSIIQPTPASDFYCCPEKLSIIDSDRLVQRRVALTGWDWGHCFPVIISTKVESDRQTCFCWFLIKDSMSNNFIKVYNGL